MKDDLFYRMLDGLVTVGQLLGRQGDEWIYWYRNARYAVQCEDPDTGTNPFAIRNMSTGNVFTISQ